MGATRCPAEPYEVAVAYCMDTLDVADAEAFDEHLLVCNECGGIVEATEQYVRAMRVAAERIQAEPDAR